MHRWDISDLTLPEVYKIDPPAADNLLVLTILYHPDPDRMGQRALLTATAACELSRLTPLFQSPREPIEQRPLEDAYLSREPVALQQEAGGWVLKSSASGRSLTVNGRPVKERLRLSKPQLEQGVALCLSQRVVLWLQLGAPAPIATDCCDMVGEATALQQFREALCAAAKEDVAVLLLGESGSGKELAAHAIHSRSARSNQPLVPVNMAAIPADLAAAELFGVSRGAFTGADKSRDGYFSQANGGTLFLDELGDCDSGIQAQLLRALEQQEIQRPGGKLERVDLRVIAATDANPDSSFSVALRHRLAGVELWLPPLRERREDLGSLLRHFLPDELLQSAADDPTRVSQWANLVARLAIYHWPGNVRELANICRGLTLTNQDSPKLLIPEFLERRLQQAQIDESQVAEPSPKTVSDQNVRDALLAARWEVSQAARQLKISRQALYRRIQSIPELRTAADVPAPEVEAVYYDCKGDLEQAALRLQVSQAALRRRWRALDLQADHW
ncbi:MAG: sigma 54-interacting transcriptional regulator [Pseudomonadota bacterium]